MNNDLEHLQQELEDLQDDLDFQKKFINTPEFDQQYFNETSKRLNEVKQQLGV